MENFLNSGIEDFLKYGITGFSAFLALLSFCLLVREIRRESLRGLALAFIVVFMVFSCVLALLTQLPPNTVAAWFDPDLKSLCRQEICEIETLKDQVDQLKCVKVKGKIVSDQGPVNIIAVRQWKMWPLMGDDQLKQKFYHDAAPILLMFWSEDYGEVRKVDEDNIKDGFYDVGEVRLKKGINPFEFLCKGAD